MTTNDKITIYNNGNCTLEELLLNLPSPDERTFETQLSKITSVKESIDEAFLILRRGNYDNTISYKAFFLLCHFNRRNKDYSLYGNLLNQYEKYFHNENTFGFLYSMYLCETGKYEQAISECKKSMFKLENNVGIKHCYCDIIASYFENNYSNMELELSSENKTLLSSALEVIEDVIYEDNSYAKFHCTYGRLLALNGNFNSGIEQIKEAIDREDSTTSHYSIRISEYNKHLINISTLEKISIINKNFNEYSEKSSILDEKIDNLLTKSMEFLGFFTALISLVISSVNILANQGLNDAIQLIIVLGGVLMITLSSFSLIISSKKNLLKIIIVFLMGLTTIMTGILLRFILN